MLVLTPAVRPLDRASFPLPFPDSAWPPHWAAGLLHRLPSSGVLAVEKVGYVCVKVCVCKLCLSLRNIPYIKLLAEPVRPLAVGGQARSSTAKTSACLAVTADLQRHYV